MPFTKPEKEEPVPVLKCGIIMPISAIDGASAEHWAEVKRIITEAVDSITKPRFAAKLVSEADDVGVIQKRIIQNVYDSEIVVCDVSGKNPNVMFELGLRLAFDKPTVIIKDDKTDYSFDTGVIEHIPYPRDLRFHKVVDFKTKLADKVLATHNAATKDENHSPFLKNFGQFHVAKLPQTEVSADALILERLAEMQREMRLLRRRGAEFTSTRESEFTHEKYVSHDKVRRLEEIIQNIAMIQSEDPYKWLPSTLCNLQILSSRNITLTQPWRN